MVDRGVTTGGGLGLLYPENGWREGRNRRNRRVAGGCQLRASYGNGAPGGLGKGVTVIYIP